VDGGHDGADTNAKWLLQLDKAHVDTIGILLIYP
jgi:hypothetical protein